MTTRKRQTGGLSGPWPTYQYRDYDDAKKAAVVKMHESGLSQAEIARRLDTCLNAIRSILQESADYKTRRHGQVGSTHRLSTVRIAWIAQELVESGMETIWVAMALRLTESRVWQLRKIDVQAALEGLGYSEPPAPWQAELESLGGKIRTEEAE